MADWLDQLNDEDRAFIKRFVLASGSLKALAAEYGISYPTVRLRLDRLIHRIEIYESGRITSDFEKMLRAQVVEGKLDLSTFKAVLAGHQKELEAHHEAVRDPVGDRGRGGDVVRDKRG